MRVHINPLSGRFPGRPPILSARLLTGLICIGTLLGCDSSPNNLGSDLVGNDGGRPEAITLETSVFETDPDADITGGSGTIGVSRALAGIVDDPALGMISSEGHIDFAPTTVTSDAFLTSTASFADVLLDLDYVYGDTLGTITLQISDITDDWNPTGARADTTLTIGDPIMEIEVSATTQLVRFELPAEWIAENDEALRSSTFIDDFHGFQIAALSGNAIVGFHYESSSMRIAVPGDTARFAMSKVVSTVHSENVPDSPAGAIVLQDGARARIAVDFDLSDEELVNNFVHRSIFRIARSDAELLTPTGFHRPELTSLSLSLVTGEDKLRIQVATGTVGETGFISFENTLLTNAIRNLLRAAGGTQFEDASFEVSVPIDSGGLGVLLLEDATGTVPPEAVLTVTKTN